MINKESPTSFIALIEYVSVIYNIQPPLRGGMLRVPRKKTEAIKGRHKE